LNVASNFLRDLVISVLHRLRQSRTLHTLTFGPISGVHFTIASLIEHLRLRPLRGLGGRQRGAITATVPIYTTRIAIGIVMVFSSFVSNKRTCFTESLGGLINRLFTRHQTCLSLHILFRALSYCWAATWLLGGVNGCVQLVGECPELCSAGLRNPDAVC
jgi:hypothetical protein